MNTIMSRREFIRLLSLGGGGLVLASCAPVVAPTAVPAPTSVPAAVSSPVPTTAPTVQPTAAPTAVQPQYGGVLTFAQTNEPPNFDPISNTTGSVIYAIAPCYNSLVMFDPMDPNKVIGDLAQSWDVSADGKVYTFKLVQNAKFHDGKPLTAADVKYTFDTIRNPPQGIVSARKASLSVVDGIETPDDFTVRLVLKRSSPSLLVSLANGWMLVLPKHILQAKGDMKKDVIGTGPFKLKEYLPGVSIELVKNPDYHVKGRPYLDGIKSFTVPDAATALAYFRSGQILQCEAMTGDNARRAQSEFGDKVVIQTSPSTSFMNVQYNCTRKPWDDIKVRQAATLAIDRNAVLKIAQSGDGALGGLMMPGPWALPMADIEAIPGYGSDINANRAQAKKLLAEAGYANGLSTTMIVRNIALFTTFAQTIKDQLAQVGIDVKLDVQETAAFTTTVQKKDFTASPWGADLGVNDPDSAIDFYASSGAQNYSGLSDKNIDELFTKQSQTLNAEERKKLINQIEKAVLMQYGVSQLYWRNRFQGYSRRIHNALIHPNMDNVRRMQDVWLSA